MKAMRSEAVICVSSSDAATTGTTDLDTAVWEVIADASPTIGGAERRMMRNSQNNESPWSWTGTTWSLLSPAASPPARREAALAHDARTNQPIHSDGSSIRSSAVSVRGERFGSYRMIGLDASGRMPFGAEWHLRGRQFGYHDQQRRRRPPQFLGAAESIGE